MLTRKQTAAITFALLLVAMIIAAIHHQQKRRLQSAGVQVEQTEPEQEQDANAPPPPEMVIPGKNNPLMEAGNRVKTSVTKLGYRVLTNQMVGASALILVQKSPETPPVMIDIHATQGAQTSPGSAPKLTSTLGIPEGMPASDADALRGAVNGAMQSN